MTVKGFYDEISGKYDTLRYGNDYSAKVGQLELRFIQMYLEGGPCLEVGAGTGRATNFLLDHINEVVAVDISPRMLEKLEANIPACKNLTTRILNVYDLDQIEGYGSFKCVISLRLLSHLEDPLGALKVIKRAIAREGVIIVDLWNAWGYQAILKRFHLRKSIVYTRYLTMRQMQIMIRDAGLRIVDWKGFGFPRVRACLPLEKSSIPFIDSLAQRIIWICKT